MERTHSSASSLRRPCRLLMALLLGLLASESRAAQFTLTWADNSTNESGFRIERATGAAAFAEIATVGANVVSYVDTGLPNGTRFSYRVRAYNTAGNSGYSNVATGETPPLQSNNAPSISNIGNRTIYVGGLTGAIPFEIRDPETEAKDLVVTATANNATLIPSSAIVLAGLGETRSIAITPAAGRTGSATVTVTVSDGTLSSSDTFVVTVNAVGSGPTISVQPQATPLVPGNALTLSVSTSGAAATYQWYFKDVAITGATSSTYTVPIAQRYNAGWYHVVVTAGSVSVSSQAVTVSAASPSSTGSLANLSARASVLTGDSILIPGFVISGSGNKRVLLRMVGPALGGFGLNGVLADPQLVLKRQVTGGYVDLATNRDWSDGGSATTLSAAFASVGAFALTAGSGDAALLVDAAPGVYSVFASDEQAGRTGLSMVEIYDADAATSTARFTNMSARGFLGTGDSVMITGFVIENGPLTLLLRAVGPGLSQFGLAGALANPRIDLMRRVNGADELIASNDDWSANTDASYTADATQRVSAFALATGSRDAALVLTLPPGVYTMVAQGAGSTTGIALIELYAVP